MMRYVPLRNFIFDRLYHPKNGYFCKPDFQVGELASPINFKQLIGFDDYQKELHRRYPKNAWLTPCQIFKPYYGMTIANYIKQAHDILCKKEKGNIPIRIVEAGAGTGSAAESILYYFQNFEQADFMNLEYEIVEISPSLCSHMERKLRKSYPKMFESRKIKIINQDISQYSNKEHFYMLFFQVFDNFAHDKLLWNDNNNKFDTFSTVNLQTKQQKSQPVENDEVIKNCLSMYEKMHLHREASIKEKSSIMDWAAKKIVDMVVKKGKKSKDIFLPTFLFSFLENLEKKAPNVHLIVSDFDSLVSSIPGKNAPIVSTKGEKSQEKKDFDTYLVERGEADIFFPVDFHFLRVMHKEFLKRDANVVKSFDFIEEFSMENWTVSKSGFNPIREDFSNTCFLTSKI